MKTTERKEQAGPPKGHLNMKALGEQEGMEEYQDFQSFDALLKAKNRLIEGILRNRNRYFIVRNEANQLHMDQVYITLCNELICHAIRDDSPISDYLRHNDTEGMEQTFMEAIDVASVRERVEIEPHFSNQQPFEEFLSGVRSIRAAQKAYQEEYSADDPVGPIRIWGALHPNIEKYGKILQLENKPVASGLVDKPFYYVNGDTTKVKMGGSSPVEVGRIIIKKRPFTIFVMDHHEYTSEVLTPDRHCIIPFSEAQELEKPCFNGELFLVPPGAWIHINDKTIHYAPFPLFSGVVTSSVIFAEGTTTEMKADFHHHHFPYKRRFL